MLVVTVQCSMHGGTVAGCHTVSEKGYFATVVVLLVFSLNSPGTHGKWPLLSRCKSLLLLSIGMVAVGVFAFGAGGESMSGGAGVSIYGTDLYASLR